MERMEKGVKVKKEMKGVGLFGLAEFFHRQGGNFVMTYGLIWKMEKVCDRWIPLEFLFLLILASCGYDLSNKHRVGG